jgi:phospholipase C
MSRKKTPDSGHTDIHRRRVLKGLAAAAGSAALPGYVGESQAALPALPPPAQSGIDHIVVVMMENRSFDHFLGWVPGSNGGQKRQYPDKNGVLQNTFRLSTNPDYGWQACTKEDPSHSYSGGRKHYNNGLMNGYMQTVSSEGDLYPLGYYTGADLPFYKGVADNYTVCDRYFTGILSQTFPNRMYMHSGQTDRNNNTLPYAEQAPSTLPTIWDLLKAKGVSRRYYWHDLPFLGLWGPKYMPISPKFEQFLTDAAAGQLPSVSFIDPFFGASAGEGDGIARDDHPHADVRDGQVFLNQVYNALRNGPQWSRTLLIINYDEWGGFFDHVPPPLAPVSDVERNVIGNDGRLGIRVPCVILGPRARRAHVSKFQFDPNSILNMIRWRFGLGSLSVRDNTSLNLAYALDFANPPSTFAPRFNFVSPLTGFNSSCSTGLRLPLPEIITPQFLETILDPVQRQMVEHKLEQRSLITLARRTGWPV